MKVVCDSNVLISAFLFPGGPPDKIFRAILSKRLSNATSPDILTEIRRVLEKKFEVKPARAADLIALIIQNSALCYPVERLAVIKEDPEDNRILECAVSVKAELIITDDKKHLLPLKRFQNIVITNPAAFVQHYGIL